MTRIRIAPSILSADFTCLARAVTEVAEAGADWIHVDVMDGHFVPNLTFGMPIVAALRRITGLPLDVHLMIEAPERYLKAFARAGADRLIVHVEACPHLHRVIQQIRGLGLRAGVALNPATPLSALEEILPDVDQVLIMTVNPGFGGQAFIERMLEKVRRARRMIDALGQPIELEVDGGVGPENAPVLVEAGATVLVAGASIFEAPEGPAEALHRLRRAIESIRVG
ncbi:ribulose-phosphate 3-epimerase [Thermoflexus sp.]|uniref:ribulose-phosphate 3-epimerase n=1 Tax=Thermoflexus sp. TaxID=1969742 RepID=UPI0025D2DE46|nr:ribulose-phosphate 3-epimerase [Thermoflexus sp.]MDW8180495.1 ribulose-phosphate 3-epimerase [Anaerolineae bacterium]MCS6962468.1 ribulose-phosphate 3-epimerase [Thermoflexus sp.]MCS7351042.1 ribulose-phosphate 3-epimerase [Thermoflexus sp.]MCX7690530.1 ribulose-phosphate 3-epimerase [Thermoflexus sp.]MDW8183982.1 ribulose-phosphate 3-epimerase [Anaerolineae bacterium]